LERIAPDRAAIAQRGKRLEYFSIIWNSLEGLLSVLAGLLACSIALVGFGIDSFIEVTSAGALLWRMHVDANAEKRERNERIALRIVGACFVGLAIYIAVDAVMTLLAREPPERSIFGIAIALTSLVVMPLLARAKRRVAAGLNSAAMKADSRQTDFCMYLSSILLVGLVLNWLFGWWWADPLAALVMVPIIAKEGVEGLRAKHCDSCTPRTEGEPQEGLGVLFWQPTVPTLSATADVSCFNGETYPLSLRRGRTERNMSLSKVGAPACLHLRSNPR